jgi:hypothetical protein
VRRFYSHWKNFLSPRTFSWCDKWRLHEEKDRRVRRLMAKENKKERDKVGPSCAAPPLMSPPSCVLPARALLALLT